MEDIQQLLHTITKDLLDRMNIAYDKILITQKDETTIRINVLSADAQILIGKFGENLDAFQYIIKLLMPRESTVSYFIIFDVEGYKERQEEKVKNMAQDAARSVQESGYPRSLPPMSGYFRKIAHMGIKEMNDENLSTESEGFGNERHIVIKKVS